MKDSKIAYCRIKVFQPTPPLAPGTERLSTETCASRSHSLSEHFSRQLCGWLLALQGKLWPFFQLVGFPLPARQGDEATQSRRLDV